MALKGPAPEEEMKNAEAAVKILGGKTEKIEKITLADGIEHTIVIIKKTDETPSKYPRKAGKPSKAPLKG